MSPIKEPNYFSKDINPDKFNEIYKKSVEINLKRYIRSSMAKEIHIAFIQDWETYIQLFKNAKNEKALGEISNSYLFSKVSAREIKKKINNAKIIMILRNPIERAFSHYLMDLKAGFTKLPFIKAIEKDISSQNKGWGRSHLYIELGLYYEQVKRYIELFHEDNIKIILFEEYKTNTEIVIREILKFLEVDTTISINTNERYNYRQVPRFRKIYFLLANTKTRYSIGKTLPCGAKEALKRLFYTTKCIPKLTNKEKDFLLPFFEEDILKLSKLINQDLSCWLSINENKAVPI